MTVILMKNIKCNLIAGTPYLRNLPARSTYSLSAEITSQRCSEVEGEVTANVLLLRCSGNSKLPFTKGPYILLKSEKCLLVAVARGPCLERHA